MRMNVQEVMQDEVIKKEFKDAFQKYVQHFMKADGKWHTYSFVFRLLENESGNELIHLSETLTGVDLHPTPEN